MIFYSKHWCGFPLLCRIYGSPMPRAFPFACFSGFITYFIEEYAGDETRLWFDHPYPYSIFAFILGFVLIFRTNFGYQRYWEGRTRIQDMASKWVDALYEVIVFDEQSVDEKAKNGAWVGTNAEGKATAGCDVCQQMTDAANKLRPNKCAQCGATRIESGAQFRVYFIHLMSLMHALALQSLRGDVVRYQDFENDPKFDSLRENLYDEAGRQFFSPTGRERSRDSYFEMNNVQADPLGSIVASEGERTFSLKEIRLGLGLGSARNVQESVERVRAKVNMRESVQEMAFGDGVQRPDHTIGSPTTNTSTSGLFAHASEKWTCLHKLRGIFVLAPEDERTNLFNASKPLPVVGQISEEEIAALETTSQRTHMAFGWVLRAIGRRSQQKGINAAAPVFSRVYQVLSDGMLGYNNAVKLHDTPFPFPYSQLIFFNLLLLSITVPWLISAKIGDYKGEYPEWGGTVVAVGMSFIIVLMYYTLNEVARDLEDPFNFDPNELPLVVMQVQFNAKIQALVSEDSYLVEKGVLHDTKLYATGRQPEAQTDQILELAKSLLISTDPQQM